MKVNAFIADIIPRAWWTASRKRSVKGSPKPDGREQSRRDYPQCNKVNTK